MGRITKKSPVRSLVAANDMMVELIEFFDRFGRPEDEHRTLSEFLADHPDHENASEEDINDFLGDTLCDAATSAGVELRIDFRFVERPRRGKKK